MGAAEAPPTVRLALRSESAWLGSESAWLRSESASLGSESAPFRSESASFRGGFQEIPPDPRSL